MKYRVKSLHIIWLKFINQIRFIGKESNDLDEINVIGVKEDSVMEYSNVKEFYNWILKLRPKNVKDYGISKMALWKVKDRIERGIPLNPKTKIVRILIELYESTKTEF